MGYKATRVPAGKLDLVWDYQCPAWIPDSVSWYDGSVFFGVDYLSTKDEGGEVFEDGFPGRYNGVVFYHWEKDAILCFQMKVKARIG